MNSISRRLLRWYDRHGRDLPWRKTHDPYKILVSEVMLQQTQVPRMLLFYKKWLQQFPNWKALAGASNAEVVRAWSGLGYNRRALMLRDVARVVAESGVPRSEEDWKKIKGIGPYTAAAVSLFAQNQATLPLDTNVRRVLGRVLLGKPYPQPKNYSLIRANKRIVFGDAKRQADVVQALFDLAAMVCKKRPLCAVCPLRRECKAAPKFLAGKVTIPTRSVKKAASVFIRASAILIVSTAGA